MLLVFQPWRPPRQLCSETQPPAAPSNVCPATPNPLHIQQIIVKTEGPWIGLNNSIWLQRMAVDAPLGLESLKVKVAELYKFRDHFFEENSLSEARGKAGQVGERKAALLEVFREEESKIAVDERATFLYLRGRVQNISGEYSPDAEATLSKAVKLNPDLVDAWNELGECYMMKQVSGQCSKELLQKEVYVKVHRLRIGKLQKPVLRALFSTEKTRWFIFINVFFLPVQPFISGQSSKSLDDPASSGSSKPGGTNR